MSAPRFFVDRPLFPDALMGLPQGVARHAQVLRLKVDAPIVLFNGEGGEWSGRITHMGRSEVQVQLFGHDPVEREISSQVTWAVGMPTNDRMDTLVEKATELGVHRVQPLMCDRSVLRLQAADRAERKTAHWQAVAVAACEQCGRNRVPTIEPVMNLAHWLEGLPPTDPSSVRFILSLKQPALWQPPVHGGSFTFLSGPEGGWSPTEENWAVERNFLPISMGPRTLRSDTAPLMVLSALGFADVVR